MTWWKSLIQPDAGSGFRVTPAAEPVIGVRRAADFLTASDQRRKLPPRVRPLVQFMLGAMLRQLRLEAAPELTVRLSPTHLVPDVVGARVLQPSIRLSRFAVL
jgi:hypothetical protein